MKKNIANILRELIYRSDVMEKQIDGEWGSNRDIITIYFEDEIRCLKNARIVLMEIEGRQPVIILSMLREIKKKFDDDIKLNQYNYCDIEEKERYIKENYNASLSDVLDSISYYCATGNPFYEIR